MIDSGFRLSTQRLFHASGNFIQVSWNVLLELTVLVVRAR